MNDKIKKVIDSHRRMNEIGGFLLGIGLGFGFAQRLNLTGIVPVLIAFGGLAILIYEQKKWNKFKSKE